MKMWSGRLRRPLNPEFEAWQRSFPFDQRLLAEEITASQAHARALHAAGVLSGDELTAILNGLEYLAAHGHEFCGEEEAEDVHHFVEKQLVAAIGETALKLHTGRSRNEQIATDLRLYLRRRCDEITGQLAGLIAETVQRARQAGDHAMPSYTHTQRAEPVLVAHWLLAYCEMWFRDADRLADCRKRLNLCPLGSGAVAGAAVPLDRAAMAKELGFDAPTANSMDATSDRDFALEFVQALSILGVHLSRWAEEFILFSTYEYGFVRLPESYSTGSSALPQKQNPDALELIRGKSARLIGAATQLLVTVKGLTLSYNKDLQETQELVYEAAHEAAMMLRVAADFMREVEFDFERMQQAARTGFMDAMAAATYLSRKGVPFRRAHELVGSAVRLCLEKHCELRDLSLVELQAISPEFDSDFYASLTLDAVLDCHMVVGGTARTQVAQALRHAEERVTALKESTHARA